MSECAERVVREYPAGLWRERIGDPGVLVAAQFGQYRHSDMREPPGGAGHSLSGNCLHIRNKQY